MIHFWQVFWGVAVMKLSPLFKKTGLVEKTGTTKSLLCKKSLKSPAASVPPQPESPSSPVSRARDGQENRAAAGVARRPDSRTAPAGLGLTKGFSHGQPGLGALPRCGARKGRSKEGGRQKGRQPRLADRVGVGGARPGRCPDGRTQDTWRRWPGPWAPGPHTKCRG